MLRAKYLTAKARKKLLRWIIDNKRLNNYNNQTSKIYRLYIGDIWPPPYTPFLIYFLFLLVMVVIVVKLLKKKGLA